MWRTPHSSTTLRKTKLKLSNQGAFHCSCMRARGWAGQYNGRNIFFFGPQVRGHWDTNAAQNMVAADANWRSLVQRRNIPALDAQHPEIPACFNTDFLWCACPCTMPVFNVFNVVCVRGCTEGCGPTNRLCGGSAGLVGIMRAAVYPMRNYVHRVVTTSLRLISPLSLPGR